MTNLLSNSQDPYTESSEWYDILSEQHWRKRRACVRDTLRAACPDAKRVLDIGSGTGLAITLIAELYPQAEIHAIEPSASMRIGLMTRILADAQLRKQVTVHPVDIAQALLPADIDVALVCGCVGFFDDSTRRELWLRLTKSLTPMGIVLVDVMPLDKPQPVPESQVASTQVGQHRYDIWLSGHPVENIPEIIRWRMRFSQFDGTRPIRSLMIERDWRTFGLQKVLDEAGAVGLKAEPLTNSPVPAALLHL